MNKTEYLCPLCNSNMIIMKGDQVNPNNGITIRCISDRCPCNENVEGHSNNEKNAYEVACIKYKK